MLGCAKCGFGGSATDENLVIVGGRTLPSPFKRHSTHSEGNGMRINSTLATSEQEIVALGGVGQQQQQQQPKKYQPRLIERILGLPDEILLLILAEIDTKDLLAAAKVCGKACLFGAIAIVSVPSEMSGITSCLTKEFWSSTRSRNIYRRRFYVCIPGMLTPKCCTDPRLRAFIRLHQTARNSVLLLKRDLSACKTGSGCPHCTPRQGWYLCKSSLSTFEEQY